MSADQPVCIKIGADSVDFGAVHRYLSEDAYWCQGIPAPLLRRALDHSLCISAFAGPQQIAFARLVTDYATFGNLVDVFVLPEWRGQGVAQRLLNALLALPEVQGLRRITLTTKDAHGLYSKLGFAPLGQPDRFMEILRPNLYTGS